MHSTLYIPELLRNIFLHCRRADLAVLARTCKVFKEPALDLLWGELDDLLPLVRCLPDVGRRESPDESFAIPCFGFSRPLNKAEQDTLRGYCRRIRSIHWFIGIDIAEHAMNTIFNPEPVAEPPFPNLQSVHWGPWSALLAQRVAIPSVTSLHLELGSHTSLESLHVFADCCPYMKEFVIQTCRSEDVRISHQICRWSNLCRVDCPEVILTMDAITHLSSAPDLKWLSFTAKEDEIQHVRHGSKLVFSSLTVLRIMSRSVDTIPLLLSHLHLPRLEALRATCTNDVSRRVIKACWAAALEACPFVVSIHLELCRAYKDPTPGEEQLTLEDLDPCTAFSELRVLHLNVAWQVCLTDADLLRLASPRMKRIIINNKRGWRADRYQGITLSGLVQLLQQCPSLGKLCIAIDTSTFTKIPEGLDVSFPLRKRLSFNFVDSWIHPEFPLGVVSVFKALELDPSIFSIWTAKNVASVR